MAVATKPGKPKKTKPPEFAWRAGARWPVKAQAAGEELARIGDGDLGCVTPAEVVEESRPGEAPLHPCFEWDDPTAAEKYREEQARNLIRDVRVITVAGGEEPEPLIRYVHVDLPDEGPAYVTTARAMSDEDLRAQVLREALGLLNGIRQRYKHLGELGEVFDAIDRLPKPE